MPIESRISPNYSPEKYNGSLEDLIDVFEDRQRYWLFEPARALLGIRFGEVAALSLLFGYFEGHAIYRKGQDSKNSSRAFFCDGFVEVFREAPQKEPVLRRVAELPYEDARCGLFHEGMLRDRIFIAKWPQALLVTLPKKAGGEVDLDGAIQSVLIDPHQFYAEVERHAIKYLNSLRDRSNVSLRENFKKIVDLKWGIDKPGGVIGMDEEVFLRGQTPSR